MDEKKTPIRKPFSLRLNEEAFDFGSLSADDFGPAGKEEKAGFIPDRPPTSYWKDAWRRMRKNAVAMVALVIVALVVLFAFVGPMLVPYRYDQFINDAKNLHPWHYSLEDQERLAAAKLSPEEALERPGRRPRPRAGSSRSPRRPPSRPGPSSPAGRMTVSFARSWASRSSSSATPTPNWSGSPQARRYSPTFSAPTASAGTSWCAP